MPTEEAYEQNVRSLLSAVAERGENDEAATRRRSLREVKRQEEEREAERLAHLKSLYLVGSLAWQEAARAHALREHGVYTIEGAIRDAYGELWSLSERIAHINDDQESETGKQLHMDITNLADLEWAHQSIPSQKMRLVWDWCVIGREKRAFGDDYAYYYFLEASAPRMVKGRYLPVYRCRPKSPAAAAEGLRRAGIAATVRDVEGLLSSAMVSVIATLCHEGVLQPNGERP